jgi:hypothetical protein
MGEFYADAKDEFNRKNYATQCDLPFPEDEGLGVETMYPLNLIRNCPIFRNSLLNSELVREKFQYRLTVRFLWTEMSGSRAI